MKVCILGCGNQGGCLAALLAMENDIEQIILADIDIEKARKVHSLILSLGEKIKCKNIRTDTVNAFDEQDISRVAKGSKFVFNGILPSCNIPIMKGCLIVGAHYMDLYSLSADVPGVPWNESIEAQLGLDSDFKSSGLTALPSEGVAPGWVNLVAKYITDQLDSVDDVMIRGITWIEGKNLLAMGPAQLQISMSLRLFPSSYFLDGKVKILDSLDLGEEFEFPAPAGKKTVYLESVSCVESIIQKFAGKPIKRIMHRGSILGGTSDVKDLIFRALREQVLKNPDTEKINLVEALASSLKPIANMDFKRALESGEFTEGADTSTVEITGMKDGQRVRHSASFISTLHEAVKHIPWVGSNAYGTVGGMPIIMTLMLLRGDLTDRGVLTAAQLDNPKKIFKRIEEGGHLLFEKIEKSTSV